MPDPRSEPGQQAPPDQAGKSLIPVGGGQSRGGGGIPRGQPLGAGAGGQGGQQQKTYTIPPWFDVRPPEAREIGPFQGFQAGYTIGNTPAVIPNTAFQLPTARTGVIKSFGMQINNLLLTSQVFWTLLFNNVPVQGWTRLNLFPTPAPFFGRSYDRSIFVPEGSLIQVQIDVLDAGTYQCGCSYSGWHVATKTVALAETLYKL